MTVWSRLWVAILALSLAILAVLLGSGWSQGRVQAVSVTQRRMLKAMAARVIWAAALVRPM